MDVISTSLFDWNKATNQFTSFISDLDRNYNLFKKIYNDSCDSGFGIVSDKTGNSVTVCLYDTIMMNGDVVGWLFKPVDSDHTFTVMVFND